MSGVQIIIKTLCCGDDDDAGQVDGDGSYNQHPELVAAPHKVISLFIFADNSADTVTLVILRRLVCATKSSESPSPFIVDDP